MHTHTRYIPIFEVEVGMVLASSISLTNHGFLTVKLARGHALTASCIEQLIMRGAEYLEIIEFDTRAAEDMALDNVVATRRVQEIFAGADMSNPATAELFLQILRYRSAS